MKKLLLCSVAAAAVVAAVRPAFADPVFVPLLTSLAVAANVSVPSALISLGSAILTTGLGIGLQILLTQKPTKPESGSLAVQQSIPPRIYGYGTARVAGYVALKEERAGLLCVVQAMVGHEVTSFEDFFLNSDLVTLVGNQVQAGADGRYGGGAITLAYRTGLPTETAYGDIVAAMPDYWTFDHRGDGIASLAMVCFQRSQSQFSKIFPNQEPKPSAVIKMAKVFDPRDNTQSATDPSTWKWSDNAALCILHFECFSEYGPRRPYSRAILPVLDRWIEEADICDEMVALKSGGSEKRYRLGGFETTEHDHRTARAAMLAACDGWFIERGDGTCILTVGKYREPTVTITDDDIAGFFLQSNAGNEDRAERIAATYTYPAGGYVSVDTDSIDLDNGELPIDQDRKQTIDLTWVQSTGQASRVLKRQAIRYATPARGKLQLRLSGINALYERWVRVQSSIPRLSNVVVENKLPRLSLMEGKCSMEFIASGAEVDVYDPATDESAAPPDTVVIYYDSLYVPTGVTATAEEREQADGTSAVYVDVTWDAPLSGGTPITYYNYYVRWRIADVGGSPGQWSGNSVFTEPAISGSTITVSIFGVTQDTTIEVEVASVSPSGTVSDWSAAVPVSTERTFTAPASPDTISASSSGSDASLTARAPNSALFAGIKFYRNTSSTFSGAVNIGGTQYGSPNSDVSYTDTGLSPGNYYYWATSTNAAGTAESTPTGPASVTI